MILSVSRRTDIPRFYMDWFMNRLREGFAMVRNPVNPTQVSRVALEKNSLDCIVFWSKNPAPMLQYLEELAPYPYYIQFTINPYGKEMESGLPGLEQRLETFTQLSKKLGRHRMVWRYSPVALNTDYTPEYHLEQFKSMAERLEGFTEQCKLSFLEMYPKIHKTMQGLGVTESDEKTKIELAEAFYRVARQSGISLGACGNLDLQAAGIPKATCVDGELAARLAGAPLKLHRDTGQRQTCYCSESIDIGAYDTCLNGCAYCYANGRQAVLEKRTQGYDVQSPLLCSTLTPFDKVTHRRVQSNLQAQLSLFDKYGET